MAYVICTLPVAPIRKLPDHRSEMSSQFLFGETAEVMEENVEGWAYIKCIWDGYYGWVRLNQFKKLEEPYFVVGFAQDWINEIEFDGQKMKVPYGSNIFSGQVINALPTIPFDFNESDLRNIAFMFLNTAYSWGGRSVYGIDCSGFAQMVFKIAGISLLRDAHMQAQQGVVVDFLQQAQYGDLAFFEEPAGIISHVGILLSPTEIIHASGQVRVDTIDAAGIIHSSTGKRTHKLRIIKRVL